MHKITRGHSCLLCQQRKVRCDGQRPCARCAKTGVECIAKPPAGPRRRKAKVGPRIEDLAMKVERYEARLQAHGISLEDEEDAGSSKGEVAGTDPVQHVPSTPDSTIQGNLIVEGGHSRYIENNLWTGLNDEFQDKDRFHESSEEDSSSPTTGMYGRGESFLFGRPVLRSLASSHPQPVQIFRLWQACLDNVNPLVKLFHAPTVQKMISEAISHLENVPPSTEALMFAIYLSAVFSLTDEVCRSTFGDSRTTLIIKFSNATQQALVNSEILRTSNVVVLQAYTLYLLAMRQQYEPQTLWLLSGLAVRISQRIGLHRESALQELSIFEAEIRRRLWWQVIILDSRSAQLAGTSIDYNARFSYDIKPPLNINDSDLDPNMTDLPLEHSGVTEMLFCMIRQEFGGLMRTSKYFKPVDDINQGSPKALLAAKDKQIDDLRDLLREKYLKYCDLSVPFHRLASIVGRSATCHLRLVAHHPRQYPDKGASLPQSEKDMLFHTSLKLIEYDNQTHATKSMSGFLWHVSVFFQIDAFIYLLSELRHRVEGEEAQDAWLQIIQAYDNHPEMVNNTTNLLYRAIGNLAVKAWEKRPGAAAGNSGPGRLITPECIAILRSQRKAKVVQTTQQQSVLASSDDIHKGAGNGGWGVAESAASQDYQPNQGQWSEISNELDATLMPDYMSIDTTPMDWEYWQTLLDGWGPPMLEGIDNQVLLRDYSGGNN